MAGEDNLTAGQRLFAEQYVSSRNATAAYRRAFPGTTYATARTEGARLLANPDIRAEIDAGLEELNRRCRVSAVRTLREVAAVAFADVGELFADDPRTGLPVPKPLAEIPAATRRALQKVKVRRRVVRTWVEDGRTLTEEIEEVEYRLASKLDALDKLCRHLGLTKDGAALEKLLGMLREERASRGG